MTPAQLRTTRGLVIAAVALFVVAGWLLFVELQAVGSEGATISELTWRMWATQPWVVFLVSHTLAAPFWFLMGHFFGQSRNVYEDIRRK